MGTRPGQKSKGSWHQKETPADRKHSPRVMAIEAPVAPRCSSPVVPPTQKLVHALLGPALRRLDPKARPALALHSLWPALMATFNEVSVSGFEEFDNAVKEHQGKTIFAYFSGSKDTEGKSWCPDCVEGETGTEGCCTAEGPC